MHTKGEWKAVEARDMINIEADQVDHVKVIAMVNGHKEQLANAHLIAAAPDLLEVCQYVRKELFSLQNNKHNKYINALGKAIGKAKGERK